jgi:DNA-binding CsgD family transcriptional regulator
MDPKPTRKPTTSLLSQVLFRVFKAMACGAVLLDQNRRVVHINSRAESCLGDGIALRGGHVCATDRVCDAAFQATLDRHLAPAKTGVSGKRAQRDALGLKRQDRRPLIVRVVPVEEEARSSFENASLLLILVDPEDCPEPSDGMLQQVFGLTKSEAKVANRLMCGDTLMGIAEAHGVEVGTVRSQVKSIFAKTQTSRQSELVALMTRLAVISEE